MSSSRTGPPLRVAPSGLFSWLPLWSSPLLLFSLQVPLFLPAHRVTTSRSACLELRGHDSMFPPSRCAIRGYMDGIFLSKSIEPSLDRKRTFCRFYIMLKAFL